MGRCIQIKDKNVKPGIDYIGVGCGALIINDKGETLLMKRGPKSKNQIGFWSMPGGAVDFGENVEDAVLREVKEELDVEIKAIKLIGFTNHIMPEEKQHWVTIGFLAKIISGEPKIMEPEKCSEIKWFKLENPPENLSITTLEPINKYLNETKKLIN